MKVEFIDIDTETYGIVPKDAGYELGKEYEVERDDGDSFMIEGPEGYTGCYLMGKKHFRVVQPNDDVQKERTGGKNEQDESHTAETLPEDATERKAIPVYSGVVKYFPDALVAVAKLSAKGNEQHNPGTHLHWDRSKSGDELDALMRHLIDGHWDAVAWRALANLQKQIEEQR